MNAEEAIAYIHSAPRFKGKASLERMGKLCALLGDPQKALRFCHVAGTNGKGSTARMISAALAAGGVRTGLFISPYVTDFCERMQVDSENIPKPDLAAVTGRVQAAARYLAARGLDATEFELVTACAFLWFYERGCDIVVLEVGLGGRFDATNVIPPPLCAVITKIACDHTAVLGGTLARIAFEKCGIIKGGDVVCYPHQEEEALAVIEERRRLCGARLFIPRADACRTLEVSLDGCRMLWEGAEWAIPLGGAHQVANALTALTALGVLRGHGFRVPQEAAREGIARMRFPGRLERVCGSPPVYLDGAHNPDGAAALAAALRGVPHTVVFGAMRDKDYRGAVRVLADGARRVVACGVAVPRAEDPAEILRALDGCKARLQSAPDCAAALRLARSGLAEGETVVVCGSLYLVGEARALLLSEPGGGVFTKKDRH